MQRRWGYSGAGPRIVIVIALAAALIVLGRYFVYLAGPRSAASFGWYAYAPLSGKLPTPRPGTSAGVRVLIWLGMIAVWTAGSLFVLKPTRRQVEPS